MSEQLLDQPMTFDSFAEWCLNKDCLSTEARHTVEVLLEWAGTSECHEAEQILSGLTNLEIWPSKPISDLSPLKTLTNLTYLDLNGNQISELSPLQTLTNLTNLWLNDNQISELSPLQTLTNLTDLWLHNNQISELLPLQTLINLTSLYLHDNQISELLPLQTLTKLTFLNLCSNQISQISELLPLQTLTNLSTLWFSGNPIFELNSPLGLLRQQWQSITLSTNPIKRQKATEALKSAYTVMGKAEPELVFCSNPQAAEAWWREVKHLGYDLRQQLFQ